MKITKDLQRLKWRLTNGGFKPNEKDLIAFNNIVNYLNESEKVIQRDQKPFAILYVTFYNQLKRQGIEPQRYIREILEKGLGYAIEQLTADLNSSIQTQFFKKYGLNEEFLNHITPQEREQELEKIKEITDIADLYRSYDYSFIADNLNIEINRLLNFYDTHKFQLD
jgi:hypothetical protein